MADCSKCMATQPKEMRERLACGWLPRHASATAWRPRGLQGEPLTICAGYTVHLPQVMEAHGCRDHWERHTLRDRYDGAAPTGVLLDALQVAKSASAALEAHLMQPKEER